MTTQAFASEIVGAWQLVEWTTEEALAGERRHPLGLDAQGWLIYAAEGAMTVLMSGSDKSVSYAGRWWVDGQDVVHEVDVAHHPSLVGSQQRRRVTHRGHELILEGIERDPQGRVRTHRVSWRRGSPRTIP